MTYFPLFVLETLLFNSILFSTSVTLLVSVSGAFCRGKQTKMFLYDFSDCS